MKPASILIVEDKALIAESIETVLVKAGYSISGRTSSGEDALLLLEKKLPDVIIMDIHLSGKMDGIETVEVINRHYSIPVIYLTDFHDNITISRAKPTHPAAYLLKPFKERDLLIAIELAFFNASEGREALPDARHFVAEPAYSLNDRIFIRKNDIQQRVDIIDILWIKADRSYFEIKTRTGNYTLVGNLNLFYRKFTHPLLIRVHRSYIVNMDKITGIRGNMLIIGEADDAELPTSTSYRPELYKRLNMI